MENHQLLVDQYHACEKQVEKGKGVTIFLEILVVGITCVMKAFQETASINLNIIATLSIGVLLSWHFSSFRQRRAHDREITNIVIEGLALEKQNFMPQDSFFQSYLKKFNVIGKMARLAVFDFIFIYFFSISFTQLLQAINPELVAKLIPSSPFRTFIISACLGWAYFIPLKPLVHIKREIAAL